MKKYNFNWYKRKMTWIGNTLISAPLRFFTLFRNKGIWVFGCWEGKRYDDNSRYLYEYIQKKYPTIRCLWISRDKNVVKLLIEKGYEAYEASSKEGIKYMLLAGVSFYTNGLDDLSDICWLRGSLIVCLNHGNTGIKKAAYTLDKFKNSSLRKWIKTFRDKLFNYYYYDICVTTSEMSSALFEELYGDHDKAKYVIAGMPRNDILLHQELFEIEVPPIIDKDFKYILYLPTYREYDNTVIKDLIETLMKDNEITDLFTRKKIKFLVKPHNIDETSAKVSISNPFFCFVNSKEVESTQVLMSFADCLITDYSSCSIDFALTNKPVFIYVPDFDEYNRDNGFRNMWMSFYMEHPEYREYGYLKRELLSFFRDGSFDSSANDWINSVYLDKQLINTIYSENVLRKVLNKIGISV